MFPADELSTAVVRRAAIARDAEQVIAAARYGDRS
jgi:hypothetical protein